jgi:hypothetical protein
MIVWCLQSSDTISCRGRLPAPPAPASAPPAAAASAPGPSPPPPAPSARSKRLRLRLRERLHLPARGRGGEKVTEGSERVCGERVCRRGARTPSLLLRCGTHLKMGAFLRMSGSTMKRTWLPRKYTCSSLRGDEDGERAEGKE